MTYAGDRVVFDADSHVMELPGWLEKFADDTTREQLRPLALGGAGALADRAVAEAAERAASGAVALADDPIELLHSKGWGAVGAFESTERSHVLDTLGFAAQLVFPTFAATQFAGKDVDLLYRGSDTLNRAMAAFCGDDDRMLAVASVPWGVPGTNHRVCAASDRRGLRGGDGADRSAARRRVAHASRPPSALGHARGGERAGGQPHRRRRTTRPPGFHDNGHVVTDFLGGGENVRAKDFMAIHQRPEIFWAAMVLDGMFETFPGLRGASVEEGALWVVPWIRRLDRAMQFAKTEPPLRALTKQPSEYVHDCMRFTPFAGEPVGLDDRPGGRRPVHVLLRLSAPRGHEGPDRAVRVDDDRHRRTGLRQLLPAQLRPPVPRRRAGVTRSRVTPRQYRRDHVRPLRLHRQP